MIVKIGAVIIIAGVLGGGLYWYVTSRSVYIDQSVIQAPLINLSPVNSGALQADFVKVGDMVTVDEPVAQVGTRDREGESGRTDRFHRPEHRRI